MSTFEKICKILSDHLGVDEKEIREESEIVGDLNADPLSTADIMGNIERQFQIAIPQEETVKFRTVRDIVEFVSDQIGEV